MSKDDAELVNVCKSCLFWNPPTQPADMGAGECRRNPPKLFKVDEAPLMQTQHPATTEEHWCGEYEPKSLRPMVRCRCGGHKPKPEKRRKRRCVTC